MNGRVWLDLAPRPGPENMAIDQTLLDLADQEGLAVLRLYRWAPHCLSFGRHEPALRRYDRGAIDALEIPAVRRPSGGRAVWHAREVTYAVAAPAAQFGDLASSYHTIHTTLVAALTSLGADASLAGATPPLGLDAGACFASPVGGEVMVSGRKVVGSAQVRERAGFLQHGSILLDDDQSMIASVMRRDGAAGRTDDRSRGPSAGPSPEAPLNRLLARPVDAATIAAAIIEAAAHAWAAGWRSLDAREQATIIQRSEAHLDRFGSESWTWQR